MALKRTKLMRNLALLVCLALAPMALGEQPYFVITVSADALSGARFANDCDVQWSSDQGYSIVCGPWETCPDDWTIEDDCTQWCQQWPNNIPLDWGCSEDPFGIEVWCACWRPA